MEADKSQDLQTATWRPGESQRCTQSKASRLEPQEEPIFQFKSKGRKSDVPAQWSGRRTSPLLTESHSFCIIQPWTNWMRPTHICFPQSIDSNIRLVQKQLHRHRPNIWAPHGPVRSTYKLEIISFDFITSCSVFPQLFLLTEWFEPAAAAGWGSSRSPVPRPIRAQSAG